MLATQPNSLTTSAPRFLPHELQVLHFVANFRVQHQNLYGPTFQEIADSIPVVKSVAAYHIKHLLRDGALLAEYATFGNRKRLREGSLHVAPDIAPFIGAPLND